MTDDKALLKLMSDMLEHYKKQTKILVILFVAVLVLYLATVFAFLYYEAHMETTTTTTTTQTVDGEGNDIVNGDQYNDESQNRSTQ